MLIGRNLVAIPVPRAVQRTVPFGLFCHSILVVWYALHGHADSDPVQRRTMVVTELFGVVREYFVA
jgi:hypothetical protein